MSWSKLESQVPDIAEFAKEQMHNKVAYLATTGGSKFEAIEKLTGAGLIVKDVIVLIDRQSGAKESLKQEGSAIHAVLTITQLLDYWEQTGKVEKDKIEATRSFLAQS